MTHPSLPNYLALVSGSTHGIAERLHELHGRRPQPRGHARGEGLTWKTYAEGLPRAGWTGPCERALREEARAVPLLPPRARQPRAPPAGRAADAARARPRGGRLPNFALVVPDLCHDMHDCSVATGDAWLRRFLPPLLRLPARPSFVAFDEAVRPGSARARAGARAVCGPGRDSARGSPTTACCGRSRTGSAARLGASAGAFPMTGIWRCVQKGSGLALKLCARGDADGADRGDRGA